jgi:dipeptidase E
MTRRIIPCGGRELFHPQLVDHVLSFARRPRPKVLFLPTASGDSPAYLLTFYQQLAGRDLALDHLALFDRTVADLDRLISDQDVIVVGGGNTANMLAIWRVHGVDRALRAAYDAGTVLTGWSAGCICWFEGGTTDSFTPDLGALRDGLGYLTGSATPHYDSEARRPMVYAREIAAGLPPGIALDDGVAARYEDERLVEVVSGRADGRAFMVDRDGEHPLPVRLLG